MNNRIALSNLDSKAFHALANNNGISFQCLVGAMARIGLAKWAEGDTAAKNIIAEAVAAHKSMMAKKMAKARRLKARKARAAKGSRG